MEAEWYFRDEGGKGEVEGPVSSTRLKEHAAVYSPPLSDRIRERELQYLKDNPGKPLTFEVMRELVKGIEAENKQSE